MAFAMYGMAVVVAPAIGPTLGGWITDDYSWHWIFFINIPIGILSLILTQRVVHDPVYLKKLRKSTIRVDSIGIGLIVIGVGFLQFVLDKGQENDWFASRIILASFITAVLSLAGLIVRAYAPGPDHGFAPNPFFERQLNAMTQALKAIGTGANEASHRALAQLSSQIDLQANVLGFVNAFWLLGLLVLFLVPLPFIMRRPSPEEAKASAAIH
jgi:MFS family permease